MALLTDKEGKFLSRIPANWDKVEKAYQAKVKVLTKAQRKYRRGMDDGYNGVVDSMAIIQAGPDFERIKPDLSHFVTRLLTWVQKRLRN